MIRKLSRRRNKIIKMKVEARAAHRRTKGLRGETNKEQNGLTVTSASSIPYIKPKKHAPKREPVFITDETLLRPYKNKHTAKVARQTTEMHKRNCEYIAMRKRMAEFREYQKKVCDEYKREKGLK